MAETLKQADVLKAESLEMSDFEKLLNQEFKPKSEEATSAVQGAVKTLVGQALANTALVSNDVVKTIEGIIAELDKKLSDQVNLIIHHPDFAALEGSWRGLDFLVSNTATGENMKVKVLNITKTEVAKTLKRFKGTAWDQSPLFKKLYEDEYGTAGGEPYGALIGDYYFSQQGPDVELLRGIAQTAAAATLPS